MNRGKISVNETCEKITLDNVKFSNQRYTYSTLSAQLGFAMEFDHNTIENIEIEVIGNCMFNNTYWVEERHEGGPTLLFDFTGSDVAQPLIKFVGDGNSHWRNICNVGIL